MFVDRVTRQRGVTLIETIVFIVMISVGVGGGVSGVSPIIRASGHPLVAQPTVGRV